ncbi:MAG TPA: phosphoenolpyruvate carboxykinase (GTP) [Bacillota bacterium]|jgi:phosphoenolpyruvate carboxykinase (GTP)|nr:phosphoenolpyruvate carboxykinase (GTP) [Bacillota bacterium]HOP69679.1 phosphoenolpyruvate carboxykinase (GTP) [Bacillota bacterium]HPT34808.1 phosphoenolpyruvate carboxykinase (GTP) [Bacillota bacterium]
MTSNRALREWIAEMEALCQPDRVVWIDGSEEQKRALEREALATGEMIELNQEKWPGCLYHRTATHDVARTEHLTYICTPRQEDAGPTNNWMAPEEAYRKAGAYFKGAMKGRTMYVIPYSMGPLGSPFSKIGIELTDSIYVVLNMLIMTRVGKDVLEVLGESDDFNRGLHSKADLDPEKRLILHFPQDNTIWSVGSGYGGNVLLGKKCLSLRIASWLARQEGWLAEHMLIMGVEDPSGQIDYIAAAFPSACGKTNLAMLVPPEHFKKQGYKVWTVGDDIAWIRLGEDGRLWAVNPETGFFGVAPGTNSHSNPNAMATIRRNTIFTNVLLTEDGDVWWEGGEGDPPPAGIAWDGQPWRPGLTNEKGKPVPGANPNSRFTAPITQCPSISPEWDNPRGVPLTAIVFGGRRSSLAPLVYEAFNWQHGVYVGATMASELTAAQYGKQGKVRRDPMAMLPFCGYNMADYFRHWLSFGKKIGHPPKIFHVNWFRKDEKGRYLWPGFGENLRVLNWIIQRAHGRIDAVETPIGFVPTADGIDVTGLDITAEAMKALNAIDVDEWMEELAGHRTFFEQFGDRLPPEMLEECRALEERLSWEKAAAK